MNKTEQRWNLQQEYDSVCNYMVNCWKNNQLAGYEEYRARKFEIEKLSYLLEIKLLKERDTIELLSRARKLGED